jgi:F0F1-type ATP synthase epsilon subunit
MKDSPLFVTTHDRSGVLFKGNALTVSSYNQKGKFDVLKEHANFISLIQKEIIIVKPDGTQKTVTVGNGVMRVAGNIVDIYLGVKK